MLHWRKQPSVISNISSKARSSITDAALEAEGIGTGFLLRFLVGSNPTEGAPKIYQQ